MSSGIMYWCTRTQETAQGGAVGRGLRPSGRGSYPCGAWGGCSRRPGTSVLLVLERRIQVEGQDTPKDTAAQDQCLPGGKQNLAPVLFEF